MSKLDCAVVADLLALYAEDLVSPETAAQVEAHLQECEACSKMLRRMQAEVQLEPAAPIDPPKRVIRYLRGLRLWYLFCPLIALALYYFALHGLLRWYLWGIGIFAVVCVASQFFAGVTPYGIDWDQVRYADRAEKKSRSLWGSYYTPPMLLALPALLTIALLRLLPLVLWFVTLDVSPAIRSLPFVLVAVIAIISVINRHFPK